MGCVNGNIVNDTMFGSGLILPGGFMVIVGSASGLVAAYVHMSILWNDLLVKVPCPVVPYCTDHGSLYIMLAIYLVPRKRRMDWSASFYESFCIK